MDEQASRRLDAGTSDASRDMAVDELIQMVGAVDGIVEEQAAADRDFFARTCGRRLTEFETGMVQQTLLEAYRFQYILSGARHPDFASTLASLVTDTQLERVHDALGDLAPMRVLAAA